MWLSLILYNYEIVIPVVLAVLICVAIVRNSNVLRKWIVFLIALSLLFREFYIGVHRRFVMAKCDLEGEPLRHFDNGMRAVEDYCVDTTLYIIVVLILLIVLCMQGFSRAKSKS